MENVMNQTTLEQNVLAIAKTIDPKELISWVAEINGNLVETADWLDKSDRIDCAMFLYRLSTYFIRYFIDPASTDEELAHQLLNVYSPINDTEKELSKISAVYFHAYSKYSEGYEPIEFLHVFVKLLSIENVCSEYKEGKARKAEKPAA